VCSCQGDADTCGWCDDGFWNDEKSTKCVPCSQVLEHCTRWATESANLYVEALLGAKLVLLLCCCKSHQVLEHCTRWATEPFMLYAFELRRRLLGDRCCDSSQVLEHCTRWVTRGRLI
jgi:hypothetical protein